MVKFCWTFALSAALGLIGGSSFGQEGGAARDDQAGAGAATNRDDQDRGGATRDDQGKGRATNRDDAARNDDDEDMKFDDLTDEDFASKASVAGSFEVFTSKLAMQRSKREDIKQFAELMVNDHTRANDELLSIAGQKKYTIPKRYDEKTQQCVDKLEKAEGQDFDDMYVKEQVKAHKKAVALFQAASRKCRDADLKAWASKTLPTLQSHLRMAQKLDAGNARSGDTDRSDDNRDKDTKGDPDKDRSENAPKETTRP